MTHRFELSSIADMNLAYKELFNRTMDQKIDPKYLAGANATLRGMQDLNVKMKLKYLEMKAKYKGDMGGTIPFLEG